MIEIVEQKSNKVPGESSFKVTFAYNKDIVEAIKSSDLAIFDKKDVSWEIPVTSLSNFVNLTHDIDDIKITLLKDKTKKSKSKEYKLCKYKTQPFEHQTSAIQYGLNHDKWLLLDEPGLGKTLSIICLAKELKEKEGIEHCLVICGINTLKTNWKKEIERHSDLTCRVIGEQTTKTGKIKYGTVKERAEQLKNPIDEFFIITNIETIRSDDVIKAILKGKNKIDMVVVDEIHSTKNPSSAQGKNLLKLKNIKYKIGATGTLLMNNPLDAYVPLKFIEKEKCSYTNFRYYYCNYGGPFGNMLTGFKNMRVLKHQLSDCSLRRQKDLLNLPSKTIIPEYVDMSTEQERFYTNIKNGVVEQCDKVKITTASLLAMVTRLRQATACPSMLTTEKISSAKIDRAVDLVEQIVNSGNKVVVFSTFKESINELNERLKEYKPLLNTGDTKDEIVSKNIDKFQNEDDCKIFLGTWQKCGTGITLTSATYMIFIDTPWTQASYQQAQDRIYRVGTKSNVTIYELITTGTIDERVHQIVEDKGAIADYVVDDKISAKSLDSLKKYIEELK